ncbi:NADH-quinone oxidoreductase subunit A [Olivibacter sp. SDN3]|uniref:NADH-quinone oxidoreductase subunit A n=1 Tax=Olivibacter sp. SDN3 TaxID=2764720 RepID=UPI001650D821|nr:NADH-quinone oxidoreductase subunit A [Olivibacter sp. SDN3]QNL48464.1 NADH-quinone oxidoreductase subunit A [Olivibacter sp. SDN3]
MEDGSQITEFGKIFIYLIIGTLLVLFTLLLGKIISPNKPNKEKQSTYECGEVSQGSSWIQFNSRFYIIALIFLLFDVEMVFIFPWTTVFGSADLIAADNRWGWYTIAEMFIFVGILITGLVYVWKKGDLDWVKPSPKIPVIKSTTPAHVYECINTEVYIVKSFHSVAAAIANAQIVSKASAKPAFKPKFIKRGS